MHLGFPLLQLRLKDFHVRRSVGIVLPSVKQILSPGQILGVIHSVYYHIHKLLRITRLKQETENLAHVDGLQHGILVGVGGKDHTNGIG